MKAGIIFATAVTLLVTRTAHADIYQWDLTQLYTAGEVTLTAVPEPRSIVLVVLGGSCLLVGDWRRRKRLA